MKVRGLLVAALVLVAPVPALAQDREQTLADIRQELNVLYVEMQKLKREMSTTGAPSATVTGSSVLDRVASMEAELQRLDQEPKKLDVFPSCMRKKRVSAATPSAQREGPRCLAIAARQTPANPPTHRP